MMEWISVDCDLPNSGEVVLVCAAKGYAIGSYHLKRLAGGRYGHWCFCDKGVAGEWKYAGHDDGNVMVTHWMRLPPAPPKVRTEKVIMRHGYWEKREDDLGVCCSICGRDGLEELPYCPWCGSIMDEDPNEKEEEE